MHSVHYNLIVSSYYMYLAFSIVIKCDPYDPVYSDNFVV